MGRMIDMNLSVIMMPPIISGVSVGVLLNIVVPDIILMMFYILISGTGYCYTIYRTVKFQKKES